ncbi:protein rep, partial [Escherichia coli]
EWFLELTRQLHKRRFISTGGALKNVLQLDRETNEDLVIADDVASPFLSGSTENRCGLPVFPMVVSDVNCQELRDR